MEIIILVIMFTLSMTFIISYIRRTIKVGELCQNCHSHQSACKKCDPSHEPRKI